jgi:hypothetical protein
LPEHEQPGSYIFEFFQQFNVNFETCPLVLSMIEQIIERANEGNDAQRAASKLDTLLSFLSTIFRDKEKHTQVLMVISAKPLNEWLTICCVTSSLQRIIVCTFKKRRTGKVTPCSTSVDPL